MADRKPPQRAEELLKRYAAGAQNSTSADHLWVIVRGSYIDANLRKLLKRYAAGEQDFTRTGYPFMVVRGSYRSGANLSRVNIHYLLAEDADLSHAHLTRLNPRKLLKRYAAGERNFIGTDVFCQILSGSNLSGANLSHAIFRYVLAEDANLSRANLTRANLHDSDLTRAKLNRANLSGANLRNVQFSGADLSDASLAEAAFSHSNLHNARFVRANLSRTDLRDSDLTGAKLNGANLSGADLRNVQLRGADLSGADLGDAELRSTDLSGANLRYAILVDTKLRQVDLSDANLEGAALRGTHLTDLDLSPLCDASPPVIHEGPSTVDFRAIVKSLHSPNLKDFLQRTGMPEVFVEYMIDCARTLDPLGVFRMLQSTFISYGGPDEAFARKLYEALHRNGVTTFFFAEHAEPGKKLHRTMTEGVNQHDRMILVCSRASLDRKGVLNELERVLEREARDGGASYLIPIRLDDYVFTGWRPPNADLAQAVRDRVVADFEGADKADAKFNEGLRRLIAALKKPDPPKPAPTP